MTSSSSNLSVVLNFIDNDFEMTAMVLSCLCPCLSEFEVICWSIFYFSLSFSKCFQVFNHGFSILNETS